MLPYLDNPGPNQITWETTQTFRDLFPEFNTAPDIFVRSRLDQAQVQIDPMVWGNRAGEGHAWLTAHLLATSPGGQFARLLAKDGGSTYDAYYQVMVIQVAGLKLRTII